MAAFTRNVIFNPGQLKSNMGLCGYTQPSSFHTKCLHLLVQFIRYVFDLVCFSMSSWDIKHLLFCYVNKPDNCYKAVPAATTAASNNKMFVFSALFWRFILQS